MQGIIFIISIIIIAIAFINWINNKDVEKSLNLTTNKTRGNPSELDLVRTLIKNGSHPDAIFHDIYLERRNGTFSQIDLVMATPVGLIFFEVKDYGGWIFGSGNSTYWTQVLAFGKEKYRLYNPIIQNRRHIEELRKITPQFANIPMFSVVIFYGDCEFKKLNQIPNEVYIIQPFELQRTLDSITANHPPANYTNKREIISVLNQAKSNGDNKDLKNEHVAYVNSVKDRIGSREGRIATNYYINPIPRSVRTTLRWLRNLR